MLTEMFLPIPECCRRQVAQRSPTAAAYLCFLGAAGLMVGILAGSYPAFFLSQVSPTPMMKDLSMATPRSAGLRKGLVVFQFSISIGLICATVVAMRQLHFFKDKSLGFERRDVVLLDIGAIEYDLSFGGEALPDHKERTEAKPEYT